MHTVTNSFLFFHDKWTVFPLLAIIYSSTSLISMRYCSLPGRAYDTCITDISFPSASLSPFMTGCHRTPNTLIVFSVYLIPSCAIKKLLGSGTSEGRSHLVCSPPQSCLGPEHCSPHSALLSNALKLVYFMGRCDSLETTYRFRSRRRSGRGYRMCNRNGCIRMRWERT